MPEHTTKIGTAGGFLTVLLSYINMSDIFKTVIMSAIGTVISFSISLILNYIIKIRRK
jgi:hypothetical protein